MSLLSIWEKAQPLLKSSLGPTTYETWFSTLNIKAEGESIVIEAPDEFFKNWIIEHYSQNIEEAIRPLSPPNLQIKFAVNATLLKEGTRQQLSRFEKGFEDFSAPAAAEPEIADASLNPRFTFDNFVIGSSNRFSSAACLAVSESPGKAYNPLFIYGKVGLGKTHLMQAIAHQIKRMHPGISYYYISSEKFTNELIDAIRHRSTAQFRQKYRNIEVLLIDDIHFIAGKEATQEEFFHTFNALHNSRKQIIISSDRPPKEIANLEERLRSRFAWGLITDIQPPDFETRVAILHKKIEKEPVKVPDSVISFIAEQITSNIRELEGALIRVVAYSLLEEKPVDLVLAKAVLKDMVQETMKIITVESILRAVSDYFKVPLAELKDKRRYRHIMIPRQVAMYLTRQLTNLSLPEIGRAFGGKDHTTVLHSCKKMTNELEVNLDLKKTVDLITRQIKQ